MARPQAPASGDYNQTMVNAQASYGFGARVGLVAAYAYRTHGFRDLAEAPSSFPAEYGRHSVRVGLTMWLPLYGSY